MDYPKEPVQPTKQTQPVEKKSQAKLLYAAGGVLVFFVIFLGGFWLLQEKSSRIVESEQPFVVVLPIYDIPPNRPLTAGFVDKMEDLGYKEGVDILYKRYGYISPGPEGIERLHGIYRTYIEEGVDLIHSLEYGDTNVALQETKAAGKPIPIVAGDLINPVDLGLAESWQSSGNNLTGIAETRPEVIERALELFTTIAPNIRKIGVGTQGIMAPGEPAASYLKTLREETGKLGIELVEYTTDVPPGPGHKEEVIRILQNIQEGEIDAWVHIPGHFFANQQAFEHQMTVRLKIPDMLPAIELDDNGEVVAQGEAVGLFTYGPDFYEKGQQLAIMADKILRGGTQPSEIPLELPGRYLIMVNLKTAKAIDLAIPSEILEIADLIIE